MPHKKKKINKFRVAVVCTAAVLVALVALGVASAAGVRTPISSIAADGEPEFFSTVKPQASAAPAENTASAAPTPSSAFDGALFIGDSMTTCLKNYVTDGAGSTTALSDAEFMTRSDYSWGEAQDELNGGEGGLWLDDDTALTVTEAIDRFSATKLYIQLGKEDLTYNDVSDVTSTAQAVISALQTKYPNLEITVQAVTPMLEWIDYQGLSSNTIAQYNEAMPDLLHGQKEPEVLKHRRILYRGLPSRGVLCRPRGLVHPLKRRGLRHLGRLSPRQQNAGAVVHPHADPRSERRQHR